MPIMHAQVIRSFLAELEKLSAAGQMMFWEELQKTAANILEVKLDRMLQRAADLVLSAGSKEELAKIAYDLSCKGVDVALFREPDLQDELTAIAVAPEGGKYLSTLPLALNLAA